MATPTIHTKNELIYHPMWEFTTPWPTPFFTHVYGAAGFKGNVKESYLFRPLNLNDIKVSFGDTYVDNDSIKHWDSPKGLHFGIRIFREYTGTSFEQNSFELRKINNFAFHLTSASAVDSSKQMGVLIWKDKWDSPEVGLELDEETDVF